MTDLNLIETMGRAIKAAEHAHDVHANCEDCMGSPNDPAVCEHCFDSWNAAYELRQEALALLSARPSINEKTER